MDRQGTMFLSLWVLLCTLGPDQIAQPVDAQYSPLHLPYSINFEEEVLRNPSRMYIYEQFFETLTYAAQGDEFDNNNGTPIEYLLTLQRISYDFESVRETLETGITSVETCATCRSLLSVLMSVRKVLSSSIFFRGIKFTCQWFRLNTPSVCAGLIKNYKDEISFIMEKARKRGITSEESCTLVFGPPCGTLSSKYHTWKINVTKPMANASTDEPQQTLASEQDPEFLLLEELQHRATQTAGGDNNIRAHEQPYGLLHISDTHFDPEYEAGNLANCSEPLCCQKSSGKATNVADGAQPWGDYRRCDLPQRTFESMLEYIRDNLNDQVKFAYWTGDLPAHDLWKLNQVTNEYNFKLTSDLLRNYLGQIGGGNFKIYPTIGNHESFPPNMFTRPTTSDMGEPAQRFITKTRRLYDFLWESWKLWLPAEAEKTFRKAGYYSARPQPGLKVISMNTNYCYYFNFWLLLDSRDPAGQLAWLNDQLTESEKLGESVHIIGHIPPGLADCVQPWSTQFHALVHRFRRTIKAQFYGHTHYDEFIVYFDKDTRTVPINIAYIGPSVTTYSYLNPSFRIYRALAATNDIVDHETYFLNLTRANAENRAEWQLEYSARKDIPLEGLTPRDWSNYVDRMAQNPADFERFYTRFLHSSDRDFPCDERCVRRQLCRLKTDIAHDYRPCGRNSSGLLDSIVAWNLTSGMGLEELISPTNDFNKTHTDRDHMMAFRPAKKPPGLLWTIMQSLSQSVATFFPRFYIAHNSPQHQDRHL
ncbi:sphingomyelin phosphodiesterase-like [Tropilaelaps mercedesae]|uniref:Sphingomyelin phosphodiesterase-like n=1 Tax=Tropilaelaps mercedesae TaxID=418985 RepID=A0A1V9X1E6_9ACAR|nr:sphingomyelin phosphodiesterase-like [Tropilaelaps mercedesae]